MNSPFSAIYENRQKDEIEKIIKSNHIIEVARELGICVGKSVMPCIKRENHVNRNGPPTMTFNPIKNTFKCWVCHDIGGDVIDLVMQAKNVDQGKAVQFLSIRGEIKSEDERNVFFNNKYLEKLETTDRESIFRQFINGLEDSRGIDLIAFASTKGGTGKTLVVNNLAVIISLITRYIGIHRENTPQLIELVDLDFGKPDQQLLLGIEPEYYIEDIFYLQSKELTWNALRQNVPIENLKLVSACPVRKSKSLYYLKKNEILYMLHNSDAHIKLADFGGGSDKETLDFLSSIKSKVFVINPDRASVEAVFNLILCLLYYPMKQQFKSSSEAMNLVEQLRNCHRNGFTMNDMRECMHRIDKARSVHKQLKNFYDETIRPFKKELGLAGSKNGNVTLDAIKNDLPLLHQKVYQIMFHGNGENDNYSYMKKSSIYRTYTAIEQNVREFDSFANRLEKLLQTTLFGLIINKCDKEQADSIAENLVNRIADVFSMNMSHLGNIPEEKALRNISNYGMPFVVFDPEHEVLDHFFTITDTIIGLKSGSTEKIIFEQKDHLNAIKKRWIEQTESVESI